MFEVLLIIGIITEHCLNMHIYTLSDLFYSPPNLSKMLQ